MGQHVFTDVAAPLPSVGYSALAWGDYDNDGDLDLVLSGQSGVWETTRLFRHEGGDDFAQASAELPHMKYSSLAWGDCDNDGDLDLAVSGSTYGATPQRSEALRSGRAGACPAFRRGDTTGPCRLSTAVSPARPGPWRSGS